MNLYSMAVVDTTAAMDEVMVDMVVVMVDMVVDMDMEVTDEATVDMAVMDTIKFDCGLESSYVFLTRDRT